MQLSGEQGLGQAERCKPGKDLGCFSGWDEESGAGV